MPEYCVTGGGGYLGGHLVKALLQQGHRVRTSARDPEKLEKVGYLWELPGAKERLTIIKADLLSEGSFDDVVRGVDGVFHTAAPILPQGHDVEATLVDPIIKGCMNVVNSCVKSKSSVKRVVLTSSVATMLYHHHHHHQNTTTTTTTPPCYDESDWSDLDYCKSHNKWYAYAKTIAEKEAFKVAQQNDMDLVAVNPSFIVGPQLAPQPTSSNLLLLAITKALLPDDSQLPFRVGGFVHVDDVVAAHILAMENTRASGRLVCSSSVVHFADVVHILRSKYPKYPYTNIAKREEEEEEETHEMDTSKIIGLGFPGFKTVPCMLDDCFKSLKHNGLL